MAFSHLRSGVLLDQVLNVFKHVRPKVVLLNNQVGLIFFEVDGAPSGQPNVDTQMSQGSLYSSAKVQSMPHIL